MIRCFTVHSIGKIIIFVHIICLPLLAFRPWQILPSQWDERRFRSFAPYLIEGKGALSILLGEDEVKIRQIWGAPDFRDFASPETLKFNASTFKGNYILYNGRVAEIQYFPSSDSTESVRWFTALGIYQDDLFGKPEEEQKKYILNLYKNPETFINIPGLLDVYSRGIRFHFKENLIHRIDIFPSRWEY